MSSSHIFLLKPLVRPFVLFPHFIPNDHHDTNFVRIIIGATGFRIVCDSSCEEFLHPHFLIFWVSGQKIIRRLFPFKKVEKYLLQMIHMLRMTELLLAGPRRRIKKLKA